MTEAHAVGRSRGDRGTGRPLLQQREAAVEALEMRRAQHELLTHPRVETTRKAASRPLASQPLGAALKEPCRVCTCAIFSLTLTAGLFLYRIYIKLYVESKKYLEKSVKITNIITYKMYNFKTI